MSDYNLVEPALLKTFKEWQFNQKLSRIDLQKKMYYYYIGSDFELKEYLKTALLKVYDEEELKEDIIPDTLNITKKLINQQCNLYTNPAKRSILIKGETNKDLSDKFTNDILPNRINSIDKTNHRWSKLFNTSLTLISFDQIKKRIKYITEPSWKYDVDIEDGDINSIARVRYYKMIENQLFRIVWTKENHYKEDMNGKKSPIGSNEFMVNPYKVIPFAFTRLEVEEDFWGVGQQDVITSNEVINILLTDLLNVGALLGAWGTPVLINTYLNKQADKKGNRSSLRIGRKHPIYIDNAREGLLKPEASYLNSNPLINEIRDLIDWRIKAIANIKGLDPNSFLQNVKATSGYSKMMDMVIQLEIRKDDIEQLREYENERFELTKIIWNTHNPDNKLPEESKLKVDFAEIDLPKTDDEKWKDRAEREKRGMGDVLDWIMEDNPDIKSRSEALKYLEDRKKELPPNDNNSNPTFDQLVNQIINNNQGGQNG